MSDRTRVVVVDDDDDVREMLMLVLETEGFQVQTAANGSEALVLLRSQPCDVVLLDLMMPGVTGWDVVDVLRREGRLDHVPIAICTSSPGSAPPGFPVVPKPVDFDQMLAVIRELAH